MRLRYQLETDVQDLRSAQHSEKVQNGVPVGVPYLTFATQINYVLLD